jgi:hypothetical protein
MIEISNMRSTLLINAASAATNADQTANVDTRGFDSCRISVFQSTTTAPTTLKVEHGDTTDATSFATINATGGTDFTIAAAPASSTNPLAVFDVVTSGLRRYLRLTVRPATATANYVAIAELGRPLTGIDSATDLSAGQWVVVPPR